MTEEKETKKVSLEQIIGVVWLVIMIALWVTYQWLPGDIFMWMWIAIGWSFLGGLIGAIYFGARSKRNLLIVSLIWAAVLIFLWIDQFVQFLPGVEEHWFWVTIAWSISCGVLLLGLIVLKLVKKTQW